MPLPGCCPSCGFRGDVEAFLVEPDAKRLVARVATIDPDLGRAVLPYLRLFSGKRGLRITRAIKLIDELLALVQPGQVCRDERMGVRRPATIAMWVAGIEQMLAAPPNGELSNHHYLRAVVFGIADAAGADAERRLESDRKTGKQRESGGVTPTIARPADPMAETRAWVQQMVSLERFSSDEAEAYLSQAQQRLGGGGS